MVQFRAGDRRTMKIGIITAMPEETAAVTRALGQTQKKKSNNCTLYHAQVAGHEIVVAEAGMGFVNAAAAARQLIDQIRPDLVVSAGFCGGISAGLRVGDVVLATGLVIVSDQGLNEVPVVIAAVSRDFVFRQAAEKKRVFGGLFATTQAIMPKERLAAMLPADAPYPVVEMESGAIALLAGEKGIPFVGLRTVSDPFDEELGFALDEFCDDRMRIRIPRVLLTIARKPRIIPQLIRLAGNSRVAAASLSQAMGRLLAVM
jgi:adenosylhomocysteine nucleosidase